MFISALTMVAVNFNKEVYYFYLFIYRKKKKKQDLNLACFSSRVA